jgi:hypothetical protein
VVPEKKDNDLPLEGRSLLITKPKRRGFTIIEYSIIAAGLLGGLLATFIGLHP